MRDLNPILLTRRGVSEHGLPSSSIRYLNAERGASFSQGGRVGRRKFHLPNRKRCRNCQIANAGPSSNFGDSVTSLHTRLQASSALPNCQQRDLLHCLYSHAFRIESVNVRLPTSLFVSDGQSLMIPAVFRVMYPAPRSMARRPRRRPGAACEIAGTVKLSSTLTELCNG